MFRPMYDWVLRMAHHRHALRSLAIVSFAESSFFPIPPDVMVVPMVLARRDQAYLIAAICSAASVIGAVFGYAIGYFLWDSVGQGLVNFYHMQSKIEALRQRDTEGRWAVDVFSEETWAPYDRVALTSYFSGKGPDDLALPADPWQHGLVTLRSGEQVTAIDAAGRVSTASGVEEYDALVLATGSSAFVPPVTGADLPGAFVYRTIDDVRAMPVQRLVLHASDEGRPLYEAIGFAATNEMRYTGPLLDR